LTDKKNIKVNTIIFFKWIIIAFAVGLVGGLAGSLFHLSIDYVTELRWHNTWLVYLLPLGGLTIAAMYKFSNSVCDVDTNCVIEAVREDKKVPFKMAPLIFAATVLTHLFGGSAGREGAALQLGGSIGYNIGRIFRLSKRELHLVVIIGMSAVFAALFGTPVTAMFFSLEVTTVGVLYYSALIPCFIAAFTGYKIASLFGISPVHFDGVTFSEITFVFIGQVALLALLCAVIAMLFCFVLEKTEHFTQKLMPNVLIRGVVGGVIIVILTFAVRTYDYNGAGMDVITRAISGNAVPYAFLLKIIFTAITVASGFKGGEIVPAFFIGSTFGCVIAPLLGLDAGMGAAIGFVCLFCGVVNCPVASIMLALEVFGGNNLLIFAVAVVVSYVMSGRKGLYKSQKISYSKIENKFINE